MKIAAVMRTAVAMKAAAVKRNAAAKKKVPEKQAAVVAKLPLKSRYRRLPTLTSKLKSTNKTGCELHTRFFIFHSLFASLD